MNLYNWGKVPCHESQLLYHALAHLGREGLVLVSPAEPYVCIGYHQDIHREIDLDYCRSKHIPVFRRDLGGGAVYLDGRQLFFNLILHIDNSLAPKNREHFYKKFIQPVCDVYNRIGIPARYKPINDILCGARKISGTGAGEIGDYFCFPRDGIERLAGLLEGKPVRSAKELLQRFYRDTRIETPGITADDWLQVLAPGGRA